MPHKVEGLGETLYSVTQHAPEKSVKQTVFEGLKATVSAFLRDGLPRAAAKLADTLQSAGSMLKRTTSHVETKQDDWKPFLALAQQSFSDKFEQLSGTKPSASQLKSFETYVNANLFRTAADKAAVTFGGLQHLDSLVSEKLVSAASAEKSPATPQQDGVRVETYSYSNTEGAPAEYLVNKQGGVNQYTDPVSNTSIGTSEEAHSVQEAYNAASETWGRFSRPMPLSQEVQDIVANARAKELAEERKNQLPAGLASDNGTASSEAEQTVSYVNVTAPRVDSETELYASLRAEGDTGFDVREASLSYSRERNMEYFGSPSALDATADVVKVTSKGETFVDSEIVAGDEDIYVERQFAAAQIASAALNLKSAQQEPLTFDNIVLEDDEVLI